MGIYSILRYHNMGIYSIEVPIIWGSIVLKLSYQYRDL